MSEVDVKGTQGGKDFGSSNDEAVPLLSVVGLTVDFHTPVGLLRAVNGVDFDLAEGETLAILGESGSGKSVCVQAVMGIVDSPPGRVAAQQILYRGTELRDLSEVEMQKIRGAQIAMVFQEPHAALDPAFTVGQQIGEVLRIHTGCSRAVARTRSKELLDRVGIPSANSRLDDYPHEFSGGMCQRVMIAMALALDPKLLIADEPTTALDVTVQAQVLELLQELKAETGMGLILITHDVGVAAEVAERSLVMYAGKVVESGPTAEVFTKPTHPYTLGLIEAIPQLEGRLEKLLPIKGAPPEPRNIPGGCAFHPRCSRSVERCALEVPELRSIAEGRSSACHYAEEMFRGD